MKPAAFIPDGHTFHGLLESPLHRDVEIEWRPATHEQRQASQRLVNSLIEKKSSASQITDSVILTICDFLVAWDVVDNQGEAVKIEPNVFKKNIHPDLTEVVFAVVLGNISPSKWIGESDDRNDTDARAEYDAVMGRAVQTDSGN